MKKQFLLPLFLISLCLSVSAQKVKLSTAGKNIRKHVSYLASDELEGRRTGEKGATFAAGYLSNLFQRYKLKAGFTNVSGDKAFLQPFEFVSGVEFGDPTSMSAGENSRVLKMRSEWAPYIY